MLEVKKDKIKLKIKEILKLGRNIKFFHKKLQKVRFFTIYGNSSKKIYDIIEHILNEFII